jgi:hypothetical protein
LKRLAPGAIDWRGDPSLDACFGQSSFAADALSSCVGRGELPMKRAWIALSLGFAALLFTPRAFGQLREADHVEIGAFGEYFRWHQGGDVGLGGVGGRLSVNLTPTFQLEGEAAYDFSQVFTEGFSSPGSSGTVGFTSRQNMRMIHGLFGPKLGTNRGPLRFFVTAKGGAMAFRFDPRPATFSTFTSTVESLRASNVIGAFYPGGGVEAFFGPIGLRLDVGDEIYFSDGARNNLRVAFGPSIRF